jgi:methionyl-tRNA formyltransferase
VAELADDLGIRLLQPEKLKQIKNTLIELSPDVIVSASYGGWLPEWFLSIAPLGVVNIHPSLLPAHRGAAPVIRTILEGDTATGVCFMVTDKGWDTGDILHTEHYKLKDTETAGELEIELAGIAAGVLIRVLKDYASGAIRPVPQRGVDSYAEKVTPQETVILWQKSAEEVRQAVLAFNPVPGARTSYHSKLLKIFRAEVYSMQGPSGQVLETTPLVVGCGTGSVKLVEVQPQGKRRMSAGDYARGCRLKRGAVFGED